MLCAYCKKEFKPAYSSSLYCSKECARNAYNEKKRKKRAIERGLTEEEAERYAKEYKSELMICARNGCNNQFSPKNKQQKYCSKFCAREAKLEQMQQSRHNKQNQTSKYMNKTTFVRRLSHDLYYGR